MCQPREFPFPFALSGLANLLSIFRGLHPLLYTECPSGIKVNILVLRKAKQLPFFKTLNCYKIIKYTPASR